MRKIVALVVIGLAVAGSAAAGGLDFHVGAGYHSSYVGNLPHTGSGFAQTLKAMPLGIGAYGGVGYAFGEKKAISVGAEFAPSWDLSFSPLGVSNFGYQGRIYLKVKPVKIVTITTFGGVAGNLLGSLGSGSLNNIDPVFGARLTVFFIYAEYAAVLNSFDGIAKHEIGLGFAIFK